MSDISVGDMARGFFLSRQNSVLKTQLNTLAQELSSGKLTDIPKAVSGDLVPLQRLERSINLLSKYTVTNQEAALTMQGAQNSISGLSDMANTLSERFLLAGTTPEATLLRAVGHEAADRLGDAISHLNTQVAGRSVFSGAATDTAAVASADDILLSVKAAITGETTAEGLMAAVSLWFDAPAGGFETSGYTGSDTPMGPTRLSQTQTIGFEVTAADPEIRESLKAITAAALMQDETLLSGDIEERSKLASLIGVAFIEAQGTLASLSAKVGVTQARIEEITVENDTQSAMLQQARAEIAEAEPYETATKLQQAETQLQLHYAMTSRLSQLKLVDYL